MCSAISKLQRKFVYAAMTYPESDDTKLQLLTHIQLSYGGRFYVKSVKSLGPQVVNSFAGVGLEALCTITDVTSKYCWKIMEI